MNYNTASPPGFEHVAFNSLLSFIHTHRGAGHAPEAQVTQDNSPQLVCPRS